MTKRLLLILCLACWSVHSAQSQQMPEPGQIRVIREHTSYEVQADGTSVMTTDRALSALNQAAVQRVAQPVLTYQEGVSEVEFLEAYTLKQDGKRIDVPPDRIVIQTPPALIQAPMFSDMKLKQVIFPDVSVGDQVVYKARISVKHPVFPGHFFQLEVFSRYMRYDSASVRVKYPKSYPLKFSSQDLVDSASREEGDSVVREWTYRREQSEPMIPGMLQTPDDTPNLMMSSFGGWADLAAAYESRAREKSAVTAEVRKLADEITKGAKTPREQAERLYRWVNENIRYVAVFLGAGGYVPHDVSSILGNRYGDCKDHVVVLESLLAAKGIDSSPVLLNLQPWYKLPAVAIPSAFNHVITWIPSLGVYVDSTLPALPFGVLMGEESGKSVVHTKHFNAVGVTPPLDAATNILKTRVRLTAGGDGNARADVGLTGEGPMAAVLVGLARALDNTQVKANIVRTALNREGITGSAQFTSDPSRLYAKSFGLVADVQLQNWINVPGPGAVRLPAGLFSPLPIAALAFNALNSPVANDARPCGALTLDEELTVQLPPGMKPDALPAAASFSNEVAAYDSSYTIDAGAVKATRRLVLRYRTPLCTPAQQAAVRDVAERIRRDVSAQLTYH